MPFVVTLNDRRFTLDYDVDYSGDPPSPRESWYLDAPCPTCGALGAQHWEIHDEHYGYCDEEGHFQLLCTECEFECPIQEE
jgi:hypothetical protein